MNTKISSNNKSTIIDFGTDVFLFSQNQGEKDISNDINLNIGLGKNSELDYIFAWKNQSRGRNLRISLSGDYARANIYGFIIANKQEKSSVATVIEHASPHTQGNCLIKGLIDDNAQLILHGMIKINQTASNSQDQLTEKILVLNPNATGELKPELEISNHDVKASHATTISHIDEDQLWHLQSRGLTKEIAIRLLVNGYVSEIIQIISELIIPKGLLKRIIKQSTIK